MSYKRSREEKRRLKRLYGKAGNHYCAGIWYDPRKSRYVRYWLGARSGYRQFLKKQSNHVIRKKQETLQYGAYRKAFEFWYRLF